MTATQPQVSSCSCASGSRETALTKLLLVITAIFLISASSSTSVLWSTPVPRYLCKSLLRSVSQQASSWSLVSMTFVNWQDLLYDSNKHWKKMKSSSLLPIFMVGWVTFSACGCCCRASPISAWQTQAGTPASCICLHHLPMYIPDSYILKNEAVVRLVVDPFFFSEINTHLNTCLQNMLKFL